MCNNPQQTKKSLLVDLFGVQEVAAASFDRIWLPRTPLIELKEKKLESLASKYFSIPTDKLWYYSDTSALCTANQEAKTENADDITVQQLFDALKQKNRQKKKRSQGKLLEAKAVGRPKRDKTCSWSRSSFWAEKYSLVCEFEQSLSMCE